MFKAISNTLTALDKYWEKAGGYAYEIGVAFSFFGFMLSVWSRSAGLSDIEWNGCITGLEKCLIAPGTVKQVGFLWAPNGGLSGLIFFPVIIIFLCLARDNVERTFKRLFDRGMLHPIDENAITQEEFFARWHKRSRAWMIICLFILPAAILIVIVQDFFPIVFDWLRNPESAAERLKGVKISHPNIEFDWSIAALFQASEINPVHNIIFAFVAYLFIGVLGSSFILSAFLWMFSVCSFMSVRNLESMGYILVPDLDSPDKRLGFETFESLFGYIFLAAVVTAIVTLGMHLQNVYLRAPDYENIMQMVFGDTIQNVIAHWNDGTWGQIPGEFISVSVKQALQIESGLGTNLQFMITWLVMFLIMMIVVGGLTVWLYTTSREGRLWLVDKGLKTDGSGNELDDNDKRRLRKMRAWPISWMSPGLFCIIVAFVLLAMFYVNFLAALLVFLVLKVFDEIYRFVRRGRI